MSRGEREEVERAVGNYVHIIGKQFKHSASGAIVRINSLDVIKDPHLTATFEIVVVATPTTEIISAELVEEINYFLGSYRQINE